MNDSTFLTKMTVGVVVLNILLSGCAPLPSASTPPSQSREKREADSSQQVSEESEHAMPQFEVAQLAFAGNGDTFLEKISSAISELGQPSAHLYVEYSNENDALWQGQVLDYGQSAVLFLQQMQGGAERGLRIDVADSWESLAAEEIQTIITPESKDSMTGLPDAEIIFVRARHSGDDLWSFDVTLNHPDSGWEDYTDGWHVETPEGMILGTRILFHPHVNEMPFTRSLSNVKIPADITAIHIRSHDLISGYGTVTVEISLDQSVSHEKYEVVR